MLSVDMYNLTLHFNSTTDKMLDTSHLQPILESLTLNTWPLNSVQKFLKKTICPTEKTLLKIYMKLQ